MEYRQQYADAHVALVRFDADVRVTAITGWINGGSTEEPAAAISLWEPAGKRFLQPFVAHGPTSGPAAWQGINSLKWDVPAGEYFVEYIAVGMPLAYPYHGPVHDVPLPEAFLVRDGGELQETSLPFGVRVYGVPLSAVPESSTIGLLGGLLLGACAWWRHRRSVLRG